MQLLKPVPKFTYKFSFLNTYFSRIVETVFENWRFIRNYLGIKMKKEVKLKSVHHRKKY